MLNMTPELLRCSQVTDPWPSCVTTTSIPGGDFPFCFTRASGQSKDDSGDAEVKTSRVVWGVGNSRGERDFEILEECGLQLVVYVAAAGPSGAFKTLLILWAFRTRRQCVSVVSSSRPLTTPFRLSPSVSPSQFYVLALSPPSPSLKKLL